MPIPIQEHMRHVSAANWLIVGKGPSFSELKDKTWNGGIIALNHAAGKLKDVGLKYSTHLCLAHAIDIEAINETGEELLANCFGVIMPWVPNVRNARGGHNLLAWIEQIDLLYFLDSQDRLFFYNRKGSKNVHPLGMMVAASMFSSEAAVHLLAKCKVQSIAHVGLDGGNKYAKEFSDLTPLSNGHSSFDGQFPNIKATVKKFNIELVPMTDDEGHPLYEHVPPQELDPVPQDTVPEMLVTTAAATITVDEDDEEPNEELSTAADEELENEEEFDLDELWKGGADE